MPAPKGHTAYNINGEGGRPKVYTEEFINNEADELEIWRQKKDSMFIQDFCLERGYSIWKISDMVKENERFRQSYDLWRTKQQSFLLKGSLKKTLFHPTVALILSHSHDMHAKTETKVTGDATAPLSFAIDQVSGKTKDLVSE